MTLVCSRPYSCPSNIHLYQNDRLTEAHFQLSRLEDKLPLVSREYADAEKILELREKAMKTALDLSREREEHERELEVRHMSRLRVASGANVVLI